METKNPHTNLFLLFKNSLPGKRNKRTFAVGILSEGGNTNLYPFNRKIAYRKEVNSMDHPSSEKEKTVRHQYDSLMKKVLKGEASNYKKEVARRAAREVIFSELSKKELNQLIAMDEYAAEHSLFHVMDYDVEIKDGLLSEALEALPEKKRNIILMSYFLDMSDTEIWQLMNLVRSTVFRHRTSTLQNLKEYLEGTTDDENKPKL